MDVKQISTLATVWLFLDCWISTSRIQHSQCSGLEEGNLVSKINKYVDIPVLVYLSCEYRVWNPPASEGPFTRIQISFRDLFIGSKSFRYRRSSTRKQSILQILKLVECCLQGQCHKIFDSYYFV